MIIFNLLFAFFSFVYVALLLQYFYYWRKTKVSTIDEKQPQLPISVIIAVRNEEKGIKNCIQSILDQKYPHFEIIVIDDYSDDRTEEIVKSFSAENLHFLSLRTLYKDDFIDTMNKKKAIELGVKSAKYDLIATIDGDCIVSSANWLAHVNSAFQDKTIQYVTGIVQYENGNSLLHQFQEIDLITLMGVTAASIQMKSAYMSNGANMAYRKSAFNQIGAYGEISKLPTGDDVFLMHKIIQEFGSDSVVFLKSLEAAVTTTTCSSISELLQQRIRWLSKTSSLLSKKVIYTLVFMYLYQLMFLISFVASFFFYKSQWLLLLLFFMVKISFDLLFLNSVSSYFQKRKLLFGVLYFEILYMLYVIVIGILGLRGKYDWKNRSFKI